MVATHIRLTNRFDDALALASDLHRTQERKGCKESKIPYIAHLLAVTAIVLEHGGSEDEAIAALLHDAAEDQGGSPTLEDICYRFGDNVAGIVRGCSDTLEKPKPPWRERKEGYIVHLRDAPYSVRLVAAADKVHNARSVIAEYERCGEELWSEFTKSREHTLWFYSAVTSALHAAATPEEEQLNNLLRDLDRAVTDLERAANGGVAIEEYPGSD